MADRRDRAAARRDGLHYVSFEDWQAIDQDEIGCGEPRRQPRIEFVRVEEMLDTVGKRVRST